MGPLVIRYYDKQHSSGVGLILSRKLGKCMLGWKRLSDRLLSARFHLKYAKLTVVVCYSPTEDKDEEEKDSFYEELQRAIEETPVHDVLLILGNVNAKVVTNNEGKESIMGKYGCGVINNNGSRLEDFCQENKLIIGGKIEKDKERGNRSTQVDVSKLKDPTVMKSFQIEVKNRLTIIKNKQELSIEQFNTTLVEAENIGVEKEEEGRMPLGII
ncbi:craniofacial development protein 2-like [Saccostrea echinata]|uniref:craniofacial development protein 2-like n=1 Tax=Saccostrea echinata TaxID=191078 RepID=UPI002A80FDED|nr:craniofacial development protein 2-like [Saccostrea echinata]